MTACTRRNFLAGAALATVASAAPFAALASEAAEGNWDYEADIIAVGAGGAGLSCAIEAIAQGMDVIVIESQPYVGGSSRLCNGGMSIPCTPLQEEQGIEDSPELFAQDLISMTGTDNNPEWLTLHAQLAPELWPWLTDLGVEFKAEGLLHTQGQSVPREHHVGPASVIDILEAKALEDGATILTETTGKRLVQDAEGRIVGVAAEDVDGNPLLLKANKGVVLCTNGYSRNPDMMNQFIFGTGAENIMAFTGLGDKGEGHKMAMAVGADTRHMSWVSLLTGQHPDGAPGQSCSLIHGGAIMVNQEGERFVDESLGYGNVWDKVATQTGGYCWQIWDNDIAEEYAENDSSLYSMAKLRAYDGLLIEAPTLEELAGMIDVPADTLAATVEKYNADLASTGADTAFGRVHIVSQVGEAPAIDNGPFFAWKTGNVNYGTMGGLKVNLDQQVIHLDGDPIPGLYCAGTICTYAQMGLVPGTIKGVSASGTGFGGAVIWGRYAAQRIKELEA